MITIELDEMDAQVLQGYIAEALDCQELGLSDIVALENVLDQLMELND